jgi:hypothetical protein
MTTSLLDWKTAVGDRGLSITDSAIGVFRIRVLRRRFVLSVNDMKLKDFKNPPSARKWAEQLIQSVLEDMDRRRVGDQIARDGAAWDHQRHGPPPLDAPPPLAP